MADKKTATPRKRKLFLAVDVWRTYFGAVSVTAIYDVYMTAFNIQPHNMKHHSFSKCVESLRKLEDPDYQTGDMALITPKHMEAVEYLFSTADEEEE